MVVPQQGISLEKIQFCHYRNAEYDFTTLEQEYI